MTIINNLIIINLIELHLYLSSLIVNSFNPKCLSSFSFFSDKYLTLNYKLFINSENIKFILLLIYIQLTFIMLYSTK